MWRQLESTDSLKPSGRRAMKPRTALGIILVLLFVFGCAAGIERQGYSITSKTVPADCKVLIVGYVPFDPNKMILLGRVKMYDTGFSVFCDEQSVLQRMKEDACARGADIVDITDEKFPNAWSTCYQAKADLIRFKNRKDVALLKPDPHYAAAKIRERSQMTWRRTQEGINAGIMGGIIGR